MDNFRKVIYIFFAKLPTFMSKIKNILLSLSLKLVILKGARIDNFRQAIYIFVAK